MVVPENKIVVVKGGLGNQLFQYSFAKFLSQEFNLKISLDVSWFNTQNLRSFELNNFLIKSEFEVINSNRNFFNKLISYRSENFFTQLLKKEILPPIKFFDGYWQDIFFAKYLKYKNFNTEKLYKNNQDEYYVIHLRRGDFTTSRVHHTLPNSYYIENLELYRDKKLYILSANENDALQFIEELKINATYLPTNEISAFNLILNASGGISSNSTYCWWAIYLSKSRNWILPYRWLKKKNIFEHNLAIENTIIA